ALMSGWLGKYFVLAGEVVEMRIIFPGGKVDAGYFDHEHLEVMASPAYDRSAAFRPKGAYFTPNPIHPKLLSRSPNTPTPGIAQTTRDADVLSRRWLFVDVDPERPTNTSATDAEKALARAKALAVRDHLRALGWPEPLLCDSGNGFHLLYPV